MEGPSYTKASWLSLCSVVNVFGLMVYVGVLADGIQRAKMERRDLDAGDSINVLLCVVPTLLVCCLTNIFWLIRAVMDVFAGRGFRALVILGIVLVAWGTAYMVVRFM